MILPIFPVEDRKFRRAYIPQITRSFKMESIHLLMQCVIPVSLCGLSILGFHFALHAPSQRLRLCLIPLTLYFEVLSFTTAHNFSAVHDALVGLWAQCLLLNILHITSLLFIEKIPAPSKVTNGLLPSFCSSIRTSYHFWSNPRLIPRAKYKDRTKARRQSVSVFSFLRLAKLLLYYYLHTRVVPLLFKKLIGVIHLSDLTPPKYSLLRPAHPSKLSSREVTLRGYMAVSWVWEGILILDGANAALGLVAVITGFDGPEDWPPLFGNMTRISGGMRRFWGSFWHPLAMRPYRNYGRLVADAVVSVLFRPGEMIRLSPLAAAVRGTIIALTVFLISGLSHMAVSWNLGMHDWFDVWWFLLNFAVCAVETAVLAALRRFARRAGLSHQLQEIENSWLGSLIGLTWVGMFFFWSVPLWRYQRMYNSLEAADEKMWQALLFS